MYALVAKRPTQPTQPATAPIISVSNIISMEYDESMVAVDKLKLELITGSDSDDEMLAAASATKAALYHLKSTGQKIRVRLALHAGACLGLTTDDAVSLGTAVELLHNASLIHDDLQDRDLVRRNQEAVWVKFGDEIAICAGDLLLSAAYCAMARLSHRCLPVLPDALALMHARISTAVRGQCVDFSSTARGPISLGDYQKIVIAKSGALLSLPIELALLVSGENQWSAAAREAAEAFAVGYQIFDDLCDVEKDLNRQSRPLLNQSKLKAMSHWHDAEKIPCQATNIVLILEAQEQKKSHQTRERASTLARNIGLEKLCLAASASTHLPKNSGQLLQALAMEMHARLACHNSNPAQ